MPRDYNVYVGFASDKRGAYNAGAIYKNKNTLNSRQNQRMKSENTTDINLGKVINIGLAFNTAQKGNELIGAYTNNRLRQRKVDTAMTFAKYGIGLAINPIAGSIYMASDLGYRAISYGIGIQKQNREANYYKRLSGNTSTSGRRYKGEYL